MISGQFTLFFYMYAPSFHVLLVRSIKLAKGGLPAMTAVAEWLGLWCMESRVAGSNLDCHIDLSFFFFFFLSRKFLSFWRAIILYVTVL